MATSSARADQVLHRGTNPQRPAAEHHRADHAFRLIVHSAGCVVIGVLAATAAFLVVRAWPALAHYGVTGSWTSTRWAPSEATVDSSRPDPYGIAQFAYGSIMTSAIAMLIAVPAALAIALYCTTVGPPKLRKPVTYLVDLLAAIPSVVYGANSTGRRNILITEVCDGRQHEAGAGARRRAEAVGGGPGVAAADAVSGSA